MSLTVNEIKKDIAEYEDRIHSARLSLHYLPKGKLPYKEHKRCEKLKRKYRGEVKHCEQLIKYANEGIELRLKESEG